MDHFGCLAPVFAGPGAFCPSNDGEASLQNARKRSQAEEGDDPTALNHVSPEQLGSQSPPHLRAQAITFIAVIAGQALCLAHLRTVKLVSSKRRVYLAAACCSF